MINRDTFGDVQGFICKLIVWHPRFLMYSETPPYGPLVFTATLFWPPGKTGMYFLVKKRKTLVNTA